MNSMIRFLICFVVAMLWAVSPTVAQTTDDPFSSPISEGEGALRVGIEEVVSLPDVDGGAVRMMLLAAEPGAGRLFVNDMRGVLYTVSYDGQTVIRYLDLTASRWNLDIQSSNFDRGFQSFAFHPQFSESATSGFGKFYAYTRYVQPDVDAGLYARRRPGHPRYRVAGMHLGRSSCSDVRRRSAARAVPSGATVYES